MDTKPPAATPTTASPTATSPAAALRCRTVLVPLDGSPLAERALLTAGWLARHLEAELHVVAADITRSELWWYQRYLDELVEERPEVTAHRSNDPDVARTVHDLAGQLGPTVVCLATHGRARGAGLLGSTFSAIAAAGTSPLVAVGARARPFGPGDVPDRIVACVDGTETSTAILPEAAAWARRLGMSLTVVTVVEPAPRPWVPHAHRQRAFGPQGDPDECVRSLVGRPELAGLDVDGLVLWDPIGPDVALFEHLERRPATLLALTSHARTGVARVVLGSEAARIVHGSPLPVLVRPIGVDAQR